MSDTDWLPDWLDAATAEWTRLRDARRRKEEADEILAPIKKTFRRQLTAAYKDHAERPKTAAARRELFELSRMTATSWGTAVMPPCPAEVLAFLIALKTVGGQNLKTIRRYAKAVQATANINGYHVDPVMISTAFNIVRDLERRGDGGGGKVIPMVRRTTVAPPQQLAAAPR